MFVHLELVRLAPRGGVYCEGLWAVIALIGSKTRGGVGNGSAPLKSCGGTLLEREGSPC